MRRVRWWVVAAAIALAWAMTCLGPGVLQAQQVASDSVTLRKLAEFRASDDYERVACLAAHWEKGVTEIDSILEYRERLPCPEGTGGIAANAVPDMPEGVALGIGRALLKQYPTFIIACALHGTRFVTFQDGAKLFVPLVWCAYRQEP